MLKKNVRIQLFTEEGLISDRMVTQTTEFYTGPKEVHKGEMRIEFTITESKDAELAGNYLLKLAGFLPIKTDKKPVGRQKSTTTNDDLFTADKKEFIEDLLNKFDNQDLLIKHLREIGFVFVNSEYLRFIIPEKYKVKERHLKEYQWLIKRTKLATDPKNDKYDPQIMLGIKIMSKRCDRVILYLYGEQGGKYKVKVPEKNPIKFSKTNLIKFPHYMLDDERFKWGIEHRALLSNKDKKPSKFYMRWQPDITVGKEISISIEELNNRLSTKNEKD